MDRSEDPLLVDKGSVPAAQVADQKRTLLVVFDHDLRVPATDDLLRPRIEIKLKLWAASSQLHL
jgi:hypothetical protein